MSHHFALTALSPLDGRYARQTSVLAGYFSEFALIRYRVRVEVEYLVALLAEFGHAGNDEATVEALRALYRDFSLQDAEAVKAIEGTTRHDLKAVEYWLKERVRALPGLQDVVEWIHLGLTSEDANNLAYALMQKEALRDVLMPTLADVMEGIGALVAGTQDLPMPARTHGQPATPTTMGKELGVFLARLGSQVIGFRTSRLRGKLNGATGTFAALTVAAPDHDWVDFSRRFIRELGLEPNLLTTQIDPRDSYAELYDQLRRVNRILLDLSQDMWRYISDGYFRQRTVETEVGSSAMPHKVNPIDFENAEGNLALANSLLVFLGDKLTVSRLQRDLSDSTVLRNVGVAFGHSLLAYHSLLRGLNKVDVDRAMLAQALDQHPEVLAEAIQTVLRLEGHPNPYETLKALTRGHLVSLEAMRKTAAELMPERAEFWKTFSPADYVGVAPGLANWALVEAQATIQNLRYGLPY